MGFLHFTQRIDQHWGLPSLQSNTYWGVHSSEVKEQGCENGRPPSFRAEVKNMWKYIHHPYVFMAVCLIKHMDNFASITFMLKI